MSAESYGENGGIAYFAEGSERVTVTAAPKTGYVFEGLAECAISAMQWACGSGMVVGKPEGSGLILDPLGSTTRAEMANTMMRYCLEIIERLY